MLTPATFEPLVGSEFSIEDERGEGVVLALTEVARHLPRSHGDRTEPFSLYFLGPPGEPLPQAIYAMGEATLGRVDIFIVAIGPDGDGRQRYEAVFN